MKRKNRRPTWHEHDLLVRGVPLIAGATVLALVWLVGRDSGGGGPGFRLDDAWIHMVYGRELAETGLLAYNRGVPATGSTSPLWAGVLALVHLAFGGVSLKAVVLGVYGVGIACILACIGLVNALVVELTGKRWVGALAALTLALSPPMAAAAFSGMEIGLCAALLLGGLVALARDRHGAAGLFLALAGVTRPEAAAVLALAFVLVVAGRGRTWARLVRFSLPPLALAGLWIVYNELTTGLALPATFYMKGQFTLAELPERLAVGVTGLLRQIPPFSGHAAWIVALGLVLRARAGRRRVEAALPLLAGLAFCVANLAIIAPRDPPAFYHLRYVVPAVPLLIAGLAVGAANLSHASGVLVRALPAGLLVVSAAVGCARTLSPTSHRLHNDTRNINEVQRAMGLWIAEHASPGDWIAASDAGAVRYFSRRRTIDLMGLNTPEIEWLGDAWIRERPVSLLALMPAWLGPTNRDLRPIQVFRTERYTVTSFPQMATQLVAVCPPDESAEPVLVELAGVRRAAVYCLPVEVRLGASRDEPRQASALPG